MRPMAENISIKRNVAASYVGQIYAVLISVIMAPVYLSYMGTEAYGLIGFFTMLVGLIQLLDMGLTATVVRETALRRGGELSAGELRIFIRGLEIIFGTISITAAAAILLLSHQIATRWLKVHNLSTTDVQISIGIMGVLVPLRWVGGLYRGILIGFERMTWLAGYNILLATLRFVGVLAVFKLFGVNVKYFFAYQFVVSTVDLLGVWIMSRHLVGHDEGTHKAFSWAPLRKRAAFSLTIAFVQTMGVLLTQTDKLVLSKSLPLAMFGIFSLAVAAAGVISVAGSPISQALLPRLTKLLAERQEDAAYRLYGAATQTVGVIIYPGVVALAFLAGPIFRAWTGHVDITHHAAIIMRLYAIGNGAGAFSMFSYYIQFARGKLRLHFIGTAIVVAVLIPAFIWSGIRYGGIGTGAAAAIVGCSYFLFWVPIVHARFLPGRHLDWLINDILSIAVPTTLMCWAISWIMPWPNGRFALMGYLALAGFLLLMTSILSSSFARATLLRLAGRYNPL